MTRIFNIASLCILVLLISSCRKNKFGTGGTITATLNGNSYASAIVTGEAKPGKTAYSIFTSANSGNTESLILYIDSLTPGIYNWGNGTANAVQYNIGSTTYGTGPLSRGTIIVSPIGTSGSEVSGTFSGVVSIGYTDTVVITDGVFTNCAF